MPALMSDPSLAHGPRILSRIAAMRTDQVDVARLVKLASRTALLCALATLVGCSPNDSVRQDSLAAVLADPGRYEGRVVSVRGFVHLARNQDVIYLHVDDYRWGLEANGIWLHMPKCANRANQPVTSGYVSALRTVGLGKSITSPSAA